MLFPPWLRQAHWICGQMEFWPLWIENKYTMSFTKLDWISHLTNFTVYLESPKGDRPRSQLDFNPIITCPTYCLEFHLSQQLTVTVSLSFSLPFCTFFSFPLSFFLFSLLGRVVPQILLNCLVVSFGNVNEL